MDMEEEITSNLNSFNLNKINDNQGQKKEKNQKSMKNEENQNIFLLISCNSKEVKNALNIDDNTTIYKLDIQHTNKEKLGFQSFLERENKVICYTINGTEDILFAVPNNYSDDNNNNNNNNNNDSNNNNNNNNNNNDNNKNDNSNDVRFSNEGSRGIGIENISICISPPLSLPLTSTVVPGRTMKSIEMTLELLMLPSSSSSSSSSPSHR